MQREAYTEGESNECSDSDRRSRATTPGRALLEEVSLKPPSERNIKNRLDPPPSQDSKCEFKNHFHSFMKTPAAVKRGRSFSQPRGKEDAGSGREEGTLSRGESFKQQELSPQQQERLELENHTKRFLQRKSLMRPIIKHSDESGDDSLTQSSSKTADKEREDSCSCSEDELDSCANSNVVVSKPPIRPAVAETNGAYSGLRPAEARRRRPVESDAIGAEEDAVMKSTARRFERRQRSKSDITGLVSAGQQLEEEREEERKEEERREEERKEEERRKREEERREADRKERREAERKEAERREMERKAADEMRKRDVERRDAERKEAERRDAQKREAEMREVERRNAERKENERLTARGCQRAQGVETPVSELVRPGWPSRQEEINRHSGGGRTASAEYSEATQAAIASAGIYVTTAEVQLGGAYEQERAQRTRKQTVFSNSEYQPVAMGTLSYAKVGNSHPRPFNASRQVSEDQVEPSSTLMTTATVVLAPPTTTAQNHSSWGIPGARLLSPQPPSEKKEKERSPKFFGDNNKENRKSQSKEVKSRSEVAKVEVEVEAEVRRDSGTTSTSDILAACKSGLRRLTYRKTYTRTRSHPLEDGQEEEAKARTKSVAESPERGAVRSPERATSYTTGSSGSRIPNRPTTPGPYFGVDRPVTPGPYRPFSPTPTSPSSRSSAVTSPSIARQSWKRTNQKFNYTAARYKYGTHETFV